MTHRTGIIAVILTCVMATSAVAAPPAATPAKRALAAPDSAGVKKAAPRTPARKDAVRTLDAIRIEGEIDVPQVLFITARDYRRFRDGLGSKYQVTASDVAKSMPSPTRLRVVAPE